MFRTTIRRSIVAAALIVPGALLAQKPTAQSLFDKHAAAAGGIAAFRAATARTEIGTADITFAGVTAGYERKTVPGKMVMTLDIASYGQVIQGYDGTIGWGIDPQQGASKMPPAMNADLSASTQLTAGLWDAGSYKSAEVLDAVDFDGRKCWPVKVVTNSGRERTVYYEQATGLRAGEVVKGDAGEQKIIYADYKPFGALRVPTKTTQTTPNGDIIINITAVKFDPIDAAAFALPDAIKALP
jgi:hypothetical protein